MKQKLSFDTNPAVLLQLAGAVLALLVAFGLRLSTAQTAAVMTVATLVASLFVRARVTSPATARRTKQRSAEATARTQGVIDHMIEARGQRDQEMAATKSQLAAAQRAAHPVGKIPPGPVQVVKPAKRATRAISSATARKR